jgi:hypothetical protein
MAKNRLSDNDYVRIVKWLEDELAKEKVEGPEGRRWFFTRQHLADKISEELEFTVTGNNVTYVVKSFELDVSSIVRTCKGEGGGKKEDISLKDLRTVGMAVVHLYKDLGITDTSGVFERLSTVVSKLS